MEECALLFLSIKIVFKQPSIFLHEHEKAVRFYLVLASRQGRRIIFKHTRVPEFRGDGIFFVVGRLKSSRISRSVFMGVHDAHNTNLIVVTPR